MGLIAVGDIHGCAISLDAILKKVNLQPDDHIVFIGDYIDRGPDSKGVIDRLIKLSEEVECTFLRGNHEELMLGYLDNGEYDLWAINGGMTTLDSYGTNGEGSVISDEHIQWVRETKLYLETDEFFFVHAGLRPGLTIAENLEENDPMVYLWERGHLKATELPWEKTVVCGHTPVSAPMNTEQLINIDTGCVFYTHPSLGHLTAVRLPERRFYTIPFVG